MARALSVKQLEKNIKEAKAGQAIYMNTINFSMGAIDLLRKYIQDGTLAPDENELKDYIVPEALDKYRSGESICPQMTYIVKER